jgi:hypothetical protein
MLSHGQMHMKSSFRTEDEDRRHRNRAVTITIIAPVDSLDSSHSHLDRRVRLDKINVDEIPNWNGYSGIDPKKCPRVFAGSRSVERVVASPAWRMRD